MAGYTAFIRIIINYFPGNEPGQQIVTKQYDDPQKFVSESHDYFAALNERLGMDVSSFTLLEKVNGKILNVEHVSHDARYNFLVNNH